MFPQHGLAAAGNFVFGPKGLAYVPGTVRVMARHGYKPNCPTGQVVRVMATSQ